MLLQLVAPASMSEFSFARFTCFSLNIDAHLSDQFGLASWWHVLYLIPFTRNAMPVLELTMEWVESVFLSMLFWLHLFGVSFYRLHYSAPVQLTKNNFLDLVPGYLFQALRYDRQPSWCPCQLLMVSRWQHVHMGKCARWCELRQVVHMFASQACWIAPNNVVRSSVHDPCLSNMLNLGCRSSISCSGMLDRIFYVNSCSSPSRYASGMGLSLVTFDWNEIAFIGSPLATPCK